MLSPNRTRLKLRSLCLLVLLSLSFNSFAQLNLDTIRPINGRRWPNNAVCNAASEGCNIIRNAIFGHNGNICDNQDPIAQGCYNDWTHIQGSPQVNVFPIQIGLGINHASMWAASVKSPADESWGEDIATGIKKLEIGHKYSFSAFKRFRSLLANPTVKLDNFYVILLKCADLLAMKGNGSQTIPTNSQIIYCETDVSNTVWQRINQCFIANDEYDVVWIFPKETTFNLGIIYQAWFEIGLPELVDVTDFNAGLPPIPTLQNCNVTIGPLVNNCAVSGTIFTWYPPNGGIPMVVPQGGSQQLTNINTSLAANQGTWTLTATVPGIVTNNSLCGNTCSILSTVYVSACCAPTITPRGPIDYYIPLDYTMIGGLTLHSTATSGNQWYLNDLPISGAANPDYSFSTSFTNTSGVYSVRVNGCRSNSVVINFHQYGYGLYGEENYTLGAKIFPPGTPFFFCVNTSNNSIEQFNQGSSANYYWNILPLSTPYLSIVPGSTSLHSNTGLINFGTTGGLPNLNNYYIQGISDLNGQQKIIDFSFWITPINIILSSYNVCAGQTINIKASNDFNVTGVAVGQTLFDWEDYDFGVNSIILSPNPTLYSNPSDPTNIHKLHIPGRNVFTSPLQVKYTASGQIKRYFYYNTSNGGCFKEDNAVNVSCFTGEQEEIVLYPNPTVNQITIEAQSPIFEVEIFSLTTQVAKKKKISGLKSISINVEDLKAGVYNCKITTAKGISNRKMIIKR